LLTNDGEGVNFTKVDVIAGALLDLLFQQVRAERAAKP